MITVKTNRGLDGSGGYISRVTFLKWLMNFATVLKKSSESVVAGSPNFICIDKSWAMSWHVIGG